MIERYVNADVFTSREELVLVPIPAQETEFNEGFAAQVMQRYPLAQERIGEKGGLDPGEAILVGTMGGDKLWWPLHSLVIAGIHRRQESGWRDAPYLLDGVLRWLYQAHTEATLATAGIPGTGFSGLRGGADTDAIRATLDKSRLRVSVYQDGLSGDRAEVLNADPDLQDHAALPAV
jgi:hypothetical protein